MFKIKKIEFTYKAYVEWLKSTSRGRAESIGKILRDHCKNQSLAAYRTMDELGIDVFINDYEWTQAGEMILNNETIVI